MPFIRAAVAGLGVLAVLLTFSALDPQGAAGWLSLGVIYLVLAPALALLLAAPHFNLRQYLWNSGSILAASVTHGVVASLADSNEFSPILDLVAAVVVVTGAELGGLSIGLGIAAAKQRDTASAVGAG
jgi:hypothetical protein